MVVKRIVDEVFQDYKKTSMMICVMSCDGKCWKELGLDKSICQNEQIMREPSICIPNEKIIRRYLENPITEAIIFGGLEPFKQELEMFELIQQFREKTDDDIVIYTGYYNYELEEQINYLKQFKNIIIKFGRYVPDLKSRYDSVLGVELSSCNQYAIKIS